MNTQELLFQRRKQLRDAISDVLSSPIMHTNAFIARVLGETTVRSLRADVELIDPAATAHDGRYQGYPWLAAAGYTIGSRSIVSDILSTEFLAGLTRLRQRSGDGQEMLIGDDIGLLGIADGIHRLGGQANAEVEASRIWLLNLLQTPRRSSTWTYRLHELATELLDNRGRLQVQVNASDTRVLAPELVLRSIWPQCFQRSPPLAQGEREALAKLLLMQHDIPNEPEEASIWLRCLDILADEASLSLVPSSSDTVRMLLNIQHSLKRWVWRERSRRRNTLPSRWQIDDEYDVQSLLWAVLYPVYGSALVDETYLPGYGQVQPRADLAITTLKLIIEVKIARDSADFADIEEQVAGDLGLYFTDTALFDQLIVFIYDDCDKHHPQRYESLRSALKQRERIEEVIIVRRPGMLPNRSERNG